MDEELMQLITERVLADHAPIDAKAASPEPASDADLFLPAWHELAGLDAAGAEYLAAGDADLCFPSFFEDEGAGLPPFGPPGAKRKAPAAPAAADPDVKRSRPQQHPTQQLYQLEDLYLPAADLPCFGGRSPRAGCGSDRSSLASDSSPPLHCGRAASIDSAGGDSAFSAASPAPEPALSAEHHLAEIQRHTRLAIEALRAGRHEQGRSLVAWAHDLKNKAASELKREAELAWEACRSRERSAESGGQARGAAGRRGPAGSTKRVEQFRKNMRRWMIGTQVGVEWMVYARLEHLQAIARFLLGPALPADPASPTAVAESICKHLGTQLPQEFIDAQLAEPEPGKRYAIGPELAALLQAHCPRALPSLAFTLPAGDCPEAVAAWTARLRELFPKKPAPRQRSGSAKC